MSGRRTSDALRPAGSFAELLTAVRAGFHQSEHYGAFIRLSEVQKDPLRVLVQVAPLGRIGQAVQAVLPKTEFIIWWDLEDQGKELLSRIKPFEDAWRLNVVNSFVVDAEGQLVREERQHQSPGCFD